MKCPYCNGTWLDHNNMLNEDVNCGNCDGKGYIEQTNEEWLRSATTEELVQAIHLMTSCCYVCGKEGVDYKRCYFRKNCTGPKEIAEWLKEKHDEM